MSGSDITNVRNNHHDDVETKAQQLYRGVALAPMVRASTTPLRTLALKYGADVVYTEELVDRSLSSTTRVISTEGFVDYLRDTSNLSKKVKKRVADDGGAPALTLRIDPKIESGKLICQLGTGEAHLALEAALHVHRDVNGIDINMGCPKKFSISGGMGSALLSDPDRAGSILRTLRDSLPNTPISCKVRLLKDTQSTLDYCIAMINAGALAIGIHARRVGDDSRTPADWKTLKEVIPLLKSKYPTIPVMVNGDFYTRQEWMDMTEETGASGVLLARPALYNTSIFRRPKTITGGEKNPVSVFDYKSPLLMDKTCVVQDYLKECIKYNNHYKNVKYVMCEMMNHRRTPPERVPHMPFVFSGGQTIAKVCDSHSLADLCKVWNVDLEQEKLGLQTESALSGEHRCEDSYFLKTINHNSNHDETQEPFPKRPKTEEENNVD